VTRSKAANIAIWVLTALTAILFLLSGVPKFFEPGWVPRFADWGYPQWFLYVIASLEAIGAIGLLVPRFASYAAGLLIVIMIGAIYTHVTHDQSFVWNLGYVASLSVIGAYRWQGRTRGISSMARSSETG